MVISDLHSGYSAPVIIGGVGGSGTRLIAHCLEELDFFIGHDLNLAKDNLWFTLLFKHLDILNCSDDKFTDLLMIFYQAMLEGKSPSTLQKKLINSLVTKDRNQTYEFLKDRAISISSEHEKLPHTKQWAWKEPNTHIVLNRLLKNIPNMKYIYVVRNGLDMAHSNNQNQQKLWGKSLVGEDFKLSPYYSLKYWCNAHRNLLDTTKLMGNNFYLLNFDNFCNTPEIEIPKLITFLDIPYNNEIQKNLASLIHIPTSIGRFKQFSTDVFDPNDIAYAQNLGFDVS